MENQNPVEAGGRMAPVADLIERGRLEEYLTTQEAAAALGLAQQTLRHWSSTGRGPMRSIRIGNRLRWKLADVRRVLNGEVPAQGGAA